MGLSACAPSCDCAGGSKDSAEAAEAAKAAAAAAGTSGATEKPDTKGTEAAGLNYKSTLVPLEDGEEAKTLAKIQADVRALIATPSQAAPTTHERLFALLPDKIGEYPATAAAVKGPSEAEGKVVAGGLRRYRHEKSDLLVRVVDTVQAPGLLTTIVDELTLQGSGPWGRQTGAIIAGQPAVVRFYASGGASATFVIGGRYMLELRIRPSAKRPDIERLASGLPFAAFAADGGEAGSAGRGG